MKKKIAALAMSALISGLVVGTASAALITDTYTNDWINFPGYDVKSGNQSIGDPTIEFMVVKYDGDQGNLLNSVEIYMFERLLWDTLLINTDSSTGAWDDWNYLAREQDGNTRNSDGYIDGLNGEGFYSVGEGWSYTLASQGRVEKDGDGNIVKAHPNGIDPNYLTEIYTDVAGNFITWNVTDTATNYGYLKYDFSVLAYAINLADSYQMAYTQFCANDNMITVPEPGTLLLFGAGLAGLFGVARRRTQVL